MKLQEIAERLGCCVEGDGSIEITGVAGLDQAGPSELSFLSNPRYVSLLNTTRAAAVIIDKEVPGRTLSWLVSANPYLDFARALELFYHPPRPRPGLHPTAAVADSALLGENASIGAFCVIGEHVVIGDNAVLHPHVVIYEGVQVGTDFEAHSHAVVRERCEIGDRVILQNGAIIGPDGYGFARRDDGTHYKIVQAGKVVIEDDVEIQASTCVDRAAVGETRIKRGAKIDNLVQIGHAVSVGENTILCAQVGIAGSTTLGRDCTLAGQVGLVNHLKIGDRVVMTAQSGVPNDVPEGQKLSGYPAIENARWLRSVAVYNRLPELNKRLRAVEQKLKASAAREPD